MYLSETKWKQRMFQEENGCDNKVVLNDRRREL